MNKASLRVQIVLYKSQYNAFEIKIINSRQWNRIDIIGEYLESFPYFNIKLKLN